jgi:predicted nucleotidyltransferase
MNNGIPDDRQSNAARTVLALLCEMRIVPVLIGGCALAARGVSLETSDIDMLVNCDRAKLHEIAHRVKAAGHSLDALSEQALRDGVSAELRFSHGGIQIDLLPTSNVRENQVHARATMESWFGTELLIACLTDVIVEKLRAGRTAGLEQAAPIIMAKLSGCDRRKGLRDCLDLGLMVTHAGLIRDIFGATAPSGVRFLT